MRAAAPTTANTLLTLRLILGALISGVVISAAVVLFALRPTPTDGGSEVLLAVLGLLAPALIAAWALVGRLLRLGLRSQLQGLAEEEAAPIIHRGYFSMSLVGGAMGEAYGLFALAVYLGTAAPVALLGAGAGVLALLAQLPTGDRFRRFAEEVRGRRPH